MNASSMKASGLSLVCCVVAAVSLFCGTAAWAAPADFASGRAVEKKDTARAGWPTHLRLLSGPNGGQWFMLGEPIARALSKQVVPTTTRVGGGVDNIDAVNHRMGDVGFTLACFLGAAQSGEKEYQSIKLDNVVPLANVYPQVLYFLVRQDFAEKHNISSVESLLRLKSPVRFASLKPGTASEFILSLLLKYGYNTDFEHLRGQGWQIVFNNYAETADHFVAGDLDCFAYTAGTEVPLILTMEQHTPVMVLPLEEKVLELLSAKFKTDTYVIKPGVYKSVSKPVRTLGDYTCLVTRRDLPDNMVAAICRALWENKAAIAEVIKDFEGLSPGTVLTKGLPMHPGAAAFWTSVGAR